MMMMMMGCVRQTWPIRVDATCMPPSKAERRPARHSRARQTARHSTAKGASQSPAREVVCMEESNAIR